MNHGSLFSGIGGFDLAAEWMGWNNVFHCEKDSFCRKVLNHYWPKSDSHNDIITTDFTIYRGRIDILSGGFPCHPYSTAGKRKGKEDDRHLWPEMLRAIREIKPTYVVGENVRGLISWNDGMVFDEVQSDLETEGYNVTAFLLPASGVDAPHQRYRIWFIAHAPGAIHSGELADRKSEEKTSGSKSENEQPRRRDEIGKRVRVKSCPGSKNAPYSECCGRIQNDQSAKAEFTTQGIPNWRHFPAQSPLCAGDDGLPSQLDGITLSRHRRETIKAGGNAIVPQVAYQIFKALTPCP